MSDHGAEEIKAHVKIYLTVFAVLAVLTIVTVGVSFLDLSLGASVTLALSIATLKASLVAMFFMHLKGEVKVIFQALILTAVFFIFLMVLPLSHRMDDRSTPNAVQTATPSEAADHGAGADH